MRKWLAFLLLIVGDGLLFGGDSTKTGDEYFEKQIRPLLVEHCWKCHDDQKHEGGLRLSSRDLLLKGGDRGPAIVSGNPNESLLVRAVRYVDELKMPPKEKLSDSDIAKIERWVAAGAAWPASSQPASSAANAGPMEFRANDKQQSWWAFQSLKHTVPPNVSNAYWPRNDIDRFVLAELEARGESPSPPADRRVWLRRVTFDLTGLPPTREELDTFIADDTGHAFERVVDRLLKSTAYGQRWARHWLDVVRYADYHDGDPKARNPVCEPLEAWRYRDWVVDALNRDLPYDQFVYHQIAGDLLPAPNAEGSDDQQPYDQQPYIDGLVATTFLVNGAWDRGDADKEKMVSDMVDDQIDTVGKAFLGLTLGCARCHDHKFDPISQADYYGLAGIFYSTRMLTELGEKGGEITLQRRPLVPQRVLDRRNEQVKRIAEVNAKLAELDKQTPKPAADDPVRLALVEQRDSLQKKRPPEPPMALAVSEGGVPGGLFPAIQDVPIHNRGSYTRLGKVVPRQLPPFFVGQRQTPISHGSGRRELAAWVASPKNPLTARVIVNRIWQWHFGQGLVRTSNNFGLLSEPPVHPELLDWLAINLIEDGWSLKSLHRRIVLSETYRQSSGKVESSAIDKEHDPDNLWLGRFTARRLEAEAIRDAMLFVTGKLDSVCGGPASHDVAIPRRSLYVQTARWDRSNFASIFDAANPDASEEKRNVSTVSPQSLFFLNNSFTLAQAKELAQRLARDVPEEKSDFQVSRIQHAYRLLFSRQATDEEIAIAKQLLDPVSEDSGSEDSGWMEFAHVLLCSNEFIYLD